MKDHLNPIQLMTESFQAAVDAVGADKAIEGHLPAPPKGRTLVLGAGKAAAAMALAVERRWPAHAPLSGLVLTRYKHSLLTNRIKVVEAGHPRPDAAGESASREMLKLARALGKDDLLLGLVSGGGSSLMSLPAEGIQLEELRELTSQLLLSGATIREMNVVRKHLSGILGGQLAEATRARVVALVISDVTGDDPSYVASGPFAADPDTFTDAQAILHKYGITAAPSIHAHLERGRQGKARETPKPDNPLFGRVDNKVIASNQTALQAGARYLESQGIPAAVLGDSVTGEATVVAQVYSALARQIVFHGQPWTAPVALISGGECTVTVRGNGRGGRCTQFLMALAQELKALEGVWALACDTDGIDGSEENAGAVVSPETLLKAAAAGLSLERHASQNDGWGLFDALGDLVVTGPTLTNVNDYRVILVMPRQ